MTVAFARPLQRLRSSKLVSGVMVGGAMTVVVKLVAFTKEVLVANRFGTSDEIDAFLVAVLVPTIIANIVGDGFRDAMVPAYAALRNQIGRAASRLFSNVIWLGSASLVLACLAVLLAGDALASLVAGGFAEAKRSRTETLQMLLLPFAVFYGVSTILKGFLQAHFRFAFSSVVPAVVPLTTIVFLLLMPGVPDGAILATGMSVGAVLLMVAMAAAVRRIDQKPLLRPTWDAPTRSVLRNVFPLLVGSAVFEGCHVIDQIMASTLEPGSVAVLNYAARISTIVSTLGGIAAGQVLFPHVSELAARRDWAQLRRLGLQFSGAIVLCSLPCCLAFWLAAKPVVSLLFEHGEFTSSDSLRVAEVLQVTGLYVPGFILTLLGTRLVMALQAGRVILASTVLGFVLNIVLNYILMNLFGVKGIALSTAVVSAVSAAFLFFYFLRRLRTLESEAA